MSAAAGFGRWFTTQPLPVRIAGVGLAAWLVMLCVLPDPRPLGAPEWTVQLAQRLAGIAEPRARFVATTLLRGAGVGVKAHANQLVVIPARGAARAGAGAGALRGHHPAALVPAHVGGQGG